MTQVNDFDFDLTIDPEAYQSRGNDDMFEEDILMLRKFHNRIGINSVEFSSPNSNREGRQIKNLSFNILAISHPECAFEWIRLVVNLSSFPDVRIEDLMPRSETGDQPIKYTISDEKGIKFKIAKIKLGPSYVKKEETEYSVYFDKIISAGIGSKSANWDFYQQPAKKLHLESLMKIKFSHSLDKQKLNPVFNIEAKIKIKGWKGLIPLIGSRTVIL